MIVAATKAGSYEERVYDIGAAVVFNGQNGNVHQTRGGTVAVTVPRWLPEQICWALSDEYHANEGGHVRIYRSQELGDRLSRHGLRPSVSHHAHALHAPYWWLKCASGVRDEEAPLPKLYHRMLVWQLEKKPRALEVLERTLNPVLGKSLVVYAEKNDA